MLALTGGVDWCVWWSLKGQKGQLQMIGTTVYLRDNGKQVRNS